MPRMQTKKNKKRSESKQFVLEVVPDSDKKVDSRTLKGQARVTRTCMLVGIAGAGKSSIAEAMTNEFLHDVDEEEISCHPRSNTRECRLLEPYEYEIKRAGREERLIVQWADTPGVADPTMKMSLIWDDMKQLCTESCHIINIIYIVVPRSREAQGYEAHLSYLVQKFRERGAKDHHFCVLFTRCDPLSNDKIQEAMQECRKHYPVLAPFRFLPVVCPNWQEMSESWRAAFKPHIMAAQMNIQADIWCHGDHDPIYFNRALVRKQNSPNRFVRTVNRFNANRSCGV